MQRAFGGSHSKEYRDRWNKMSDSQRQAAYEKAQRESDDRLFYHRDFDASNPNKQDNYN